MNGSVYHRASVDGSASGRRLTRCAVPWLAPPHPGPLLGERRIVRRFVAQFKCFERAQRRARQLIEEDRRTQIAVPSPRGEGQGEGKRGGVHSETLHGRRIVHIA